MGDDTQFSNKTNNEAQPTSAKELNVTTRSSAFFPRDGRSGLRTSPLTVENMKRLRALNRKILPATWGGSGIKIVNSVRYV